MERPAVMDLQAAEVIYLLALVAAWLTIPLGVPGTLLMLGISLIYGWLSGFRELGGSVLGWMAAIAVPAEGADQFVGVWAARRYGATFKGILGSLAGAILGAMALSAPLPVVGTVIGAFIGGFVGAYAVEWLVQKDPQRALRAAWGGFLGRVAGIILKMLAGAWIWVLAWKALGAAG